MIEGTVVRGHGVASGTGGDPRFPGGTLRLQIPIFASLGLDLTAFHPGTINLDISPEKFEMLRPKCTFADVRWHPECPPETFSFFDCTISNPTTNQRAPALIYRPHPETKPEHFHDPSVLEILAPKLEGLSYGQRLLIEPADDQMRISAK